MPEFEELGFVTCPSGTLVIMDAGLFPLWSGDQQLPVPLWDLEITGPDARRAGEMFDRQANPIYLFDIPDVDGMSAFFAEFCAERGLRAACKPMANRVPHRERVRLASKLGSFNIVQYAGMWAVALRGVPQTRRWPVCGERMPAGEFEGRWRRIWVQAEPGTSCSQQTLNGVMVDEASLLFADLGALDSLEAEEVLEGLRSGEPFTLHASGVPVFGTPTSWGDGIFSVVAHFGTAGQLLRLSVELGTEDRQQLLRDVLTRDVGAVLTRRVEEGGAIVRAERLADRNWLFTTGTESEAEMKDPENFGLYELEQVLERNPGLRPFLLHGEGTILRRAGTGWEVDPG